MADSPVYWVDYKKPILDSENYQLDIHPDFQNNIFPLGKVNIFVGANNSGKSRALRALFTRDEQMFLTQDAKVNYPKVKEVYFTAFRKTQAEFARIKLQVPKTVYSALDENLELYRMSIKLGGMDALSTEAESGKGVPELDHVAGVIDSITQLDKGKDLDFNWDRFRKSLGDIGKRLERFLALDLEDYRFLVENVAAAKNYREVSNNLLGEATGSVSVFDVGLRVYIPTLRSLHSLIDLQRKRIDDDYYVQTVFTNYFSNKALIATGRRYNIHTGQNLFWEILEARNGKKEQRDRLFEFEQFISDSFFQGQAFDITANVSIKQLRNSAEGNSHHLIVNIGGTDRAIHELGDGIQSIIMLTFPIFNAPDNTWIFIEEPETHLHPGLQRLFMEVLLENEVIKKKNLRFFLTTHSNHLLDLMLTERQDISIFSFRDDPTSKKKVVKNVLSGDQDLLSQLGVQSSSVFIANCSIWVEGITDRLYMRAYLQAYQDAQLGLTRLREDLDYAFFEYAGTNLSHYLFAKPAEIEADLPGIKSMRLSNRILVLADQDEGKDRKHEGLKNAEHGNFNYHFYPEVKEVENLLHPDVLTQVLPGLFPKVNADDLDSIEYEQYKTEYLGTYLKNTLGESAFAKSDIADSGTIGSTKKLKLAEAACKVITWELMTPEARQLAELIYNFITKADKPR